MILDKIFNRRMKTQIAENWVTMQTFAILRKMFLIF